MSTIYISVKQVTSTQNWLKLFIKEADAMIVNRHLGLCSNSGIDTNSTLVNDISRAVSNTGYVINDTSSKLTKEWQYRELPKYEGTQLELRKEFAQLCIDYLKEAIRI